MTGAAATGWRPELLITAPSVAPGPDELAEIRLATIGIGWGSAAVTVDPATAAAAHDAGWIVIRDPEGAAVAALRTEPTDAIGRLTGTAVDVDGGDPGPFGMLRRRPTEIDMPGCIAVIGHNPPDGAAMTAITTSTSAVLFVVLDGPRRHPGPHLPDSVRAARELATSLRGIGRSAEVIVLPAPEYGDARDAQLRESIGVAYRADTVRPSHTADRRALLDALDRPDSPTAGNLHTSDVLADLPAPSRAAWRRFRPPRSRRGLALMFTGLSGSGKSTIARALVQALTEDGTRRVTLLDGDVVRNLLSAGLGFSRADRDLNILRIGFVAAEIVRHGGIAVCAPIAPFAETRRKVRDMVTAQGDFILVHVATPLEVCERRDRKGLYARARSGEIPEFTGISSPYEEPDDADLVIDTSSISTTDAVNKVHDVLRRGGWTP